MSPRFLTASCSPSPIVATHGRRPNAAVHSHQLAGRRQSFPVLQNAKSMTTVPRDILRRAADEKAPDFARIDADSSAGLGNTSDEPFGPSAVLLVGLLEPEVAVFKGFMEEMGATMVKIICATPDMLSGTLMDALQCEASKSYAQCPSDVQRTVFLSGLYSGEVIEVISEYKAAGLPPAVFAAAVPKNANSNLQDLCEEVLEDHRAMMNKRAP